jgi:oxygen-independent coproporphyrinogen-3 oxidase
MESGTLNSRLPSPISTGIYIHVPFCLQKCGYCSFFSIPVKGNIQKNTYLNAVNQQIVILANRPEWQQQISETIFFGGGTPSLLGADSLVAILEKCLDEFPHWRTEEMEISVEVNPATINFNGLRTLQKGGFNRISIGVQSFTDRELNILGRPHNSKEAKNTIIRAREAGFTNISIDLMYGLPGQNQAAWQDNLEQGLGLAPDHISVYELTVEENTPFWRAADRGELILPEEDETIAMLEITAKLMEGSGFHRYEISNYARLGSECRHNLNYWHNGDYIGIGPGAVANSGQTRFFNLRNMEEFSREVGEGKTGWHQERECLSNEEKFKETVIMGLRMTDGLSLAELENRFAIDPIAYYQAAFTRLLALKLIRISGNRLSLKHKGLLLANLVMVELV